MRVINSALKFYTKADDSLIKLADEKMDFNCNFYTNRNFINLDYKLNTFSTREDYISYYSEKGSQMNRLYQGIELRAFLN